MLKDTAYIHFTCEIVVLVCEGAASHKAQPKKQARKRQEMEKLTKVVAAGSGTSRATNSQKTAKEQPAQPNPGQAA
eukprot:3279185-Heterocapsa_arctica.AAC.1